MSKETLRPIGIFDSGVGGLTVAREIALRCPEESILYFGDTARCPYGPRPLDEVRGFVREIGSWLVEHEVKLMVIACNTATAAGLEMAQELFDVPVIGVVEPGARAALSATTSRRIGVIGTAATVSSGSYERAIHALDPQAEVFSLATPQLVELAESGIRRGMKGQVAQAFYDEAYRVISGYLEYFKPLSIDTLVLGCTHFPLLVPFINEVLEAEFEGEVKLISSAKETARDVENTLAALRQAAPLAAKGTCTFATSTDNVDDFARMAARIFGTDIGTPQHVEL